MNSLKDYLVRIGWKLDEDGLKRSDEKVTGTLKEWAKTIHNLRNTTMKNATSFAISAISSVTGLIIDQTVALAEEDMVLQKQAMHWFTTTEKARAFQGALDQLGLSYSDLFWTTKEQLQQFNELYELGKRLEVPEALNDTLKQVRAITQEIRKFGTIKTYFKRAVAYFIGQYAGDEIGYWLQVIRDFVKLSEEKMPQIAQKVGRALSVILNAVSGVAKAAKSVWDVLKNIIGTISSIPGLLATLSVAIGIFLLGPLGRVITAISLIALLIEDFMYWKAGKKSALGELFGDYNDSPFSTLEGSLSGLTNAISDVFVKLEEIGAFDFAGSALLKGLKLLGEAAGILADSLASTIGFLTWMIDKPQETWDTIKNNFSGIFDKDTWKHIFGNMEFSGWLPDYIKGLQTTPITNTNALTSSVLIDSHDTITVASAKEAAEYRNRKTMDNFMESYNSRLDTVFVK